MTERNWGVSIHKDGNHVELYERNAKEQVASVFESLFYALDDKLDHRLCGGNIPEKWWKINIGKRDYDEEYDVLTSSLGYRLYSLQSLVVTKLMDASEGTVKHRIPISQEQTDELWPEMSFLADDDENSLD